MRYYLIFKFISLMRLDTVLSLTIRQYSLLNFTRYKRASDALREPTTQSVTASAQGSGRRRFEPQP